MDKTWKDGLRCSEWVIGWLVDEDGRMDGWMKMY